MVFATGSGAEMRQAMGITVFSGILGVTFFGLVLTPLFYHLVRRGCAEPELQIDQTDAQSVNTHI